MKKAAAFLIAVPLALAAGAALAQERFHPRPPEQAHFAAETETETNSMSFLLSRGYQIVAGWEGTLVLQRGERVYLCPYARYREGGGGGTHAIAQPCTHLREGMHP